MSMVSDVETAEDFERYYRGKFIKSRFTGAFYQLLGRAGGIEQRLVFHVYRPDGLGEIKVSEDTLSWADVQRTLLFGLPHIGMVGYKGVVAYVSLDADRTWTRGLDFERLRFFQPLGWEFRKRGLNQIPFRANDLKSVHALLYPKYYDISDCINRLMNGDAVGMPINKSCGVYVAPDFANPLFLYKTDTVGEMIPANITKGRVPTRVRGELKIFSEYKRLLDPIRRSLHSTHSHEDGQWLLSVHD